MSEMLQNEKKHVVIIGAGAAGMVRWHPEHVPFLIHLNKMLVMCRNACPTSR